VASVDATAGEGVGGAAEILAVRILEAQDGWDAGERDPGAVAAMGPGFATHSRGPRDLLGSGDGVVGIHGGGERLTGERLIGRWE
jgi:hypothetical protein